MEWRLFPGEWYLDAGALLLAVALDLVLRELPSPLHPVVWMGKLVSWLERVGPPVSESIASVGLGRLDGHAGTRCLRRTGLAGGKRAA